jgi:hypothetical protein
MSRTYKDRKSFMDVPKWFKVMNRQEERAKQNQALKGDKEVPVFRKRDKYEYW